MPLEVVHHIRPFLILIRIGQTNGDLNFKKNKCQRKLLGEIESANLPDQHAERPKHERQKFLHREIWPESVPLTRWGT
jgi:hypothetical protein